MASNIPAQSAEKMLAAANAQILGRTCMREVRRFPAMGAADANFEASNNFLTFVKIVDDTPTTDRRFGEPVPPLGA
jgi:hypothetical protein